MSVSSGIYDANVLKKTFDEWRQKVGTQKALETYRQILKRHNQAVESSVKSRISSRLHKFSGALSSSVRTNSKITADGVYVSTYLANIPQEIDGEKHGRYQWYAPQYARFVNWGTKSHINHKKIRQSKLRQKIEREQAQIAKYQQKLSEHMQKSFLSSKIRLTGSDKKAEKYKKIIERYTSQLQKNLQKERENARYKEINGVEARKILAYLTENQDNIAQSIYNDLMEAIKRDMAE
ncbi:MAG: hypothetical protein UHU21_03875 [Lachnospiraceae bacterium]|nr:hypothetical protein [Lachnospiraceae bacterium]